MKHRKRGIGASLSLLVLGWLVWPVLTPRRELITWDEIERGLPPELRWQPGAEVPDEKNGYRQLGLMLASLKNLSERPERDLDPWSPEVSAFLDECTKEAALLDEAVHAPEFQLPAPSLLHEDHTSARLTNALIRQSIAVHYLLLRSELDEGISTVELMLRLTSRSAKGARSTLSWAMARSLARVAHASAVRIARHESVEAKHIERLLVLIPEQGISDTSLVHIKLGELHTLYLPMLVEDHEESYYYSHLVGIMGDDLRRLTPPKMLRSRLDARATLVELVSNNRIVIANATQPYDRQQLPVYSRADLPPPPVHDESDLIEVWSFWLLAMRHPNYWGAWISDEPDFGSVRFWSILDQNAARLVLCIRLFETRHGRLPASLDRLVEAGILETVPLDPYSSKPFVWVSRHSLFYSVGPDGKDNGGSFDHTGHGSDLCLDWRF